MKLIKCIYCGRPFYNDQAQCPSCGHDAKTSANNFVTKPISDATSHRRMEQILSNKNETVSNQAKTVNEDVEQEPIVAVAEEHTEEPVATPTEESDSRNEESNTDSETVADNVDESTADSKRSSRKQERTDAIAALKAETIKPSDSDETMPDFDQAETTNAPRKRHVWLWIVVGIIAVLAAAIFWKWDLVNEVIKSFLG